MPPAPGGGRPRTTDLREVLNAILYVMRTGCAWQMLPHDFPAPGTVYDYFSRWRRDGTIARIHDALRPQVRVASEREPDEYEQGAISGEEHRGRMGVDPPYLGPAMRCRVAQKGEHLVLTLSHVIHRPATIAPGRY